MKSSLKQNIIFPQKMQGSWRRFYGDGQSERSETCSGASKTAIFIVIIIEVLNVFNF
jgi:hypothetical protein